MFELILVLLVLVLGAFLFLTLSKSSPASPSHDKSVDRKHNKNEHAKHTESHTKSAKHHKDNAKTTRTHSDSPSDGAVARKGRGRTVPGLGMEADNLKLITTDDRTTSPEAAKQKAPKKHKQHKEANGAAAEKQHTVDPVLEAQRHKEQMNNRIQKFVDAATTSRKKGGKDKSGAANTQPNIRVMQDLRSHSAPWKSQQY